MFQKMLHRIWFLLIVLVFTLAGCKSYEYFTIDVLEPAEIFLPENIQRILITHNALPDSLKPVGTRFTIFGKTLRDTVFRDSLLANTSIKTLLEMTSQNDKIKFVPNDSAGFGFPDSPGDYNESHLVKIREKCDNTDADAFLILTSISKEIVYDIYYGDFGNTFGEFQVTFSSRWLLIDPYNSKLIDSKIIKDTLYLLVNKPFDRSEADNYIKSVELLSEAAELAGLKYGAYISPHYAQTERMIFISGSKAINKGYAQASAGNWIDAAYLWREALTVQDDKVRAKASFNLALASEMEGLLEPALGWAKESYRFFPDTLNATYIKILEERLESQKEIILQMEGRK